MPAFLPMSVERAFNFSMFSCVFLLLSSKTRAFLFDISFTKTLKISIPMESFAQNVICTNGRVPCVHPPSIPIMVAIPVNFAIEDVIMISDYMEGLPRIGILFELLDPVR